MPALGQPLPRGQIFTSGLVKPLPRRWAGEPSPCVDGASPARRVRETGTNAGIDLALAMIEQDYGAALARTAAQLMVVHQRRPGGQAQFAGLVDLEPNTPRIRKALNYARTHLHERLSVEDLAGIACLGPRQFSRVVRSELGMPPARVIERLRAEAARLRIETSSDPIELIARKVGFEDPERMRRAFLRVFGHPPQSIRRALRTG